MAAHLAELCRLYVLLAFLLSAGGKTLGFGEFRRGLTDSFSIPSNLSGLVGGVIIAAEWTIAALLTLDRGASGRIGMAAALSLLGLFTAVILVAFMKGAIVSCNCFGASTRRISIYDLFRNGTLMGACAFNLLYAQRETMSAVSCVLLALVALTALLMTVNLQVMVQLARLSRRGAGAAE
jgi:hypothetical protein